MALYGLLVIYLHSLSVKPANMLIEQAAIPAKVQ